MTATDALVVLSVVPAAIGAIAALGGLALGNSALVRVGFHTALIGLVPTLTLVLIGR